MGCRVEDTHHDFERMHSLLAAAWMRSSGVQSPNVFLHKPEVLVRIDDKADSPSGLRQTDQLSARMASVSYRRVGASGSATSMAMR